MTKRGPAWPFPGATVLPGPRMASVQCVQSCHLGAAAPRGSPELSKAGFVLMPPNRPCTAPVALQLALHAQERRH